MDQPDIAAAAATLGWLELIKRIGGFMVIAGVAIEVGGDWIATPFHKKVEDARQLELSKLNNETARLSAEAELSRAAIASANARAAEAQLELEKFKAPRELSIENRAALVERMRAFSGTVFDAGITAPDPEYILLVRDVIAALKNAGWNFVGWEGPGQTLYNAPDPVIGMVSVAGIAIFVNPEADPALWKPVSGLTSFFNEIGLKANNGRMAVSGNTNAKAIHVMIGRKL